MATLLCIGLMFVGVGMFLMGPLLLGWIDHTHDPYAGIKYNTSLQTTISWDRVDIYRTWEEKEALKKRTSEALDVYIASMTRDTHGESHIVLKVKRHERGTHGTRYTTQVHGSRRTPASDTEIARRRQEALAEWQQLCTSVIQPSRGDTAAS